MIRSFDRRVWIGGALLAVNGGLVNAVGLSCFAWQTVSHVTGTSTLLALALARGDWGALLHFGWILGSFAAGAVVAGFVVRDSVLRFGRRYGAALALECLILAAAALRTTHMTGIVTDLGAAAGHLLGGVRVDWLRVRFHALLLGSFLSGAALGGLSFAAIGFGTLWLAVGLTAALTAAYLLQLAPKRP